MATYRDHRRAALAVSKLQTDGFDAGDVRVEPASWEVRRVAPPTPLGTEASDAARRAGIVGVAVGAVVAFTVGWWAIAVAVVSPLVGAGAAVARRAWAVAARGRRRVVPTRYDVCVTRRAAHANHLLARWWEEGLDGPPRTETGDRVLA